MTQVTPLRKVILACMIGNALEWYDFALFGFFVGIIGHLFFPNHDPVVSIIASYGAFGAAFIMRPVGALVLGTIGDKLGRKPALILSLYLMALPSVAIGLLPPYAMIGIMAPILLTLIRFFQGFSMGGEFTGSMIFIAEQTSENRRGLMTSFAPCSVFIGIVIGSGVATLTTLLFEPAILESWGWRLAFLLSLVGTAIGVYIRRHLSETAVFQDMQRKASESSHLPIKQLFSHYWKRILLTVTVECALGVSAFYIISFMATYLIQFHGLLPQTALLINTGAMFLCGLAILFFGWLSDKIRFQWIMLAGCLGYLFFAYLLFEAFSQGLMAISVSLCLLALCHAAIFAPMPKLLFSLFPAQVRYTGMSFAHNLSMAITGGTAPIIATALIHHTGNPSIPAVYLSMSAAVSMVGILLTFHVLRDSSKQ